MSSSGDAVVAADVAAVLYSTVECDVDDVKLCSFDPLSAFETALTSESTLFAFVAVSLASDVAGGGGAVVLLYLASRPYLSFPLPYSSFHSF